LYSIFLSLISLIKIFDSFRSVERLLIRMESNKDESERCIKIAEDAIRSGETEKALKFLHKAQRLYASPRCAGICDDAS
jgi:hypothetical protein